MNDPTRQGESFGGVITLHSGDGYTEVVEGLDEGDGRVAGHGGERDGRTAHENGKMYAFGPGQSINGLK